MIDNDQSTIIETPEVYKSTPTHSPSKNQRQNVPGKNVDFDTFDVHVMVNYEFRRLFGSALVRAYKIQNRAQIAV